MAGEGVVIDQCRRRIQSESQDKKSLLLKPNYGGEGNSLGES